MPVTVVIHFKELGDSDFTTASSQQYHFIPRIGDIVTPLDSETICKVIAVVPKHFDPKAIASNSAAKFRSE